MYLSYTLQDSIEIFDTLMSAHTSGTIDLVQCEPCGDFTLYKQSLHIRASLQLKTELHDLTLL